MELVGITAGNFGFKCTHNFRDSTHFAEQTTAACSLFIILPLNAVYSQLFYGPPYGCRAANCQHQRAHESTCDEPMNDVEWHNPVSQLVQGYLYCHLLTVEALGYYETTHVQLLWTEYELLRQNFCQSYEGYDSNNYSPS